jgi:hypothetical protein
MSSEDFRRGRTSAKEIPNNARNARDGHHDDGILLHSRGLQTHLRHSEVTMKDGALRINVQGTLEVILGQLELLLSKVLWFEITKGKRRGIA